MFFLQDYQNENAFLKPIKELITFYIKILQILIFIIYGFIQALRLLKVVNKTLVL